MSDSEDTDWKDREEIAIQKLNEKVDCLLQGLAEFAEMYYNFVYPDDDGDYNFLESIGNSVSVNSSGLGYFDSIAKDEGDVTIEFEADPEAFEDDEDE